MIAFDDASDLAGPSPVDPRFVRAHSRFALGGAAGQGRFRVVPVPRSPTWSEAFATAFRRDRSAGRRVSARVVCFQGTTGCVRLDDGDQELVVGTTGAPRILSYRRKDGTNRLDPGMPESNGIGLSRRGHVAQPVVEPEIPEAEPSLSRCRWVAAEGGVRFLTRGDGDGRIRYELGTRFLPSGLGVRVEHVLTGLGAVPSRMALRMVCSHGPTGSLVVPRADRGSGAFAGGPTSALELWPDTDLRRPCWAIGPRYLRLRHLGAECPQRLATRVPQGWIAHVDGTAMFLRRFDGSRGGLRFGSSSNVELSASVEGLESTILWTSGSLDDSRRLVATEEWRIVPAPFDPTNEDLIDTLCLPVVGEGVPMR